MTTDDSASAASEIEIGVVWTWRVEEVSPYVGIRIGGIGWNYGGPMIG